MIFTKSYRWRFGDIDEAGIGYYPNYFHYFHCLFEDWWSEGLGKPYPQVLRNEHLGLPAVALQAEFFAPVRYGDEPDFSLGVLAIGSSSVTLGYWLRRPADPGPAARARVTTVAVDVRTMRKQPLPERWRRELERWRIAEAEFPGRR
jgi:4-hydroxybenzoyl-CoA thioesterase